MMLSLMPRIVMAAAFLSIPALAEAETKCLSSDGYVAIARDHGDEAGSDLILRQSADGASGETCRFDPRKGDANLLPRQNDNYLLDFHANLLVLDGGTGSMRQLTIIDVVSKKRIVSDAPYADDESLAPKAGKDGVTFWQIGKAVSVAVCANKDALIKQSATLKTAHETEETTVTYGKSVVHPTGKTSCVITEDDLSN